eukprot:TRINITY_DN1497_c0_g1_i1.p1 TRINITY_DN1497_c0_g1~~TRINITY_DN1497_c0_g1_i1.p1  ORF type:complete len:384 (+),score=73.55 TRINITY_DN1497_c0_g1_i1:87-1238(+)
MGERRLTESSRTGGSKGSSWWEDDPDTILSKKMSDILRHRAKEFGLEMRPDGYVSIRDLLKIDRGRFFAGITEKDVVRIVQNNKKVRFSLSEDERAELLVRANQGHTLEGIEDDSLLTQVQSALELDSKGEICVHGTYWSAWEIIRKEGLKPMGRQHIHFATHAPADSKEIISGMRTTSEIMIYLDVPKAIAAGMKLFRSSNSVLLTRGLDGVVRPEFFSQVVQRFPRKILWSTSRSSEGRVPGLGSAASVKQASNKTHNPAGHEASSKRPSKDVPKLLDSWEDEEEADDDEEEVRDGAVAEHSIHDAHIEDSSRAMDGATLAFAEGGQLGSAQRKNRFTSKAKPVMEQHRETQCAGLASPATNSGENDGAGFGNEAKPRTQT